MRNSCSIHSIKTGLPTRIRTKIPFSTFRRIQRICILKQFAMLSCCRCATITNAVDDNDGDDGDDDDNGAAAVDRFISKHLVWAFVLFNFT